MIGIYCITNLVNGKKYIGQSNNIIRRWERHKNPTYIKRKENKSKPLYQAIIKYGLENFSFEILEECKKEELNDKEEYWISFYQTFPPELGKGYNLTKGGQGTYINMDKSYPHLNEIKDLLENSNLTQQEIANKFGVAQTMISGINSGKHFYDEEIEYPIRKSRHSCNRISRGYSLRPKSLEINKGFICPICGGKKSEEAAMCKKCASKKRIIRRPSFEELLSKLYETQNHQATADYFEIATVLLHRWMDDLGIPRKRPEYNNLYRVKILGEEPILPKEVEHFKILKINPENNEVVEEFKTAGDAVESVGVNRKSKTAFFRALNTKETFKGFKWEKVKVK